MRLTQARLYSNVGIDYWGLCLRVFAAVFDCLVIEAIDLEVSDITSDGFIAAFKRFVVRRGKPLKIL